MLKDMTLRNPAEQGSPAEQPPVAQWKIRSREECSLSALRRNASARL